MKNVLYIDPFSSDGHILFNKIYTGNLINSGVNLDLVFKEDYYLKLGLRPEKVVLEIPEKYFRKYSNGLINRIYFIKTYLFIKKNINLKNYDSVILAGYEEISLYLSGLGSGLILVNHNNIQGLNNSFKRFFFKLLSKKNTHLVFNTQIKEYLCNLGIKNVIVVPHGLPNAIETNSSEFLIESKAFFSELNLSKFSSVLFLPSNSSNDTFFLEKLFNCRIFLEFLEKKNMLFVAKGKFNIGDSNNIVVIKDYLSENQYKAIFMKSDFILLPYPKTFKLRISAVLFECMVNNKICFLSDIEAFEDYSSFFRYNPYYSSIESLILLIDKIQNSNKLHAKFTNLERLNPEFNNFLNYNFKNEK